MEVIRNIATDEERAFYAAENIEFISCRFEGAKDGESALKESRNIRVSDCDFVLRYPFWHTSHAVISGSRLYDTCRAAIWYSDDIYITCSKLLGIKALRECRNIRISDSEIVSSEFGWFCDGLNFENVSVESEYFLMHSKNLVISGLRLKGKYSFQYCTDVEIHDSVLDTKDAFWETENVTVYDSVIKGEYLAWYAKNLKLVRCRIEGTQPLCYSENVILEDCTMDKCDLSFEKTSVNANVKGHIDSVKNPAAGYISADSIGEIIDEYDTPCTIVSAR